ncbi:hypothetical protein [Pseudoalteromonas sp. GutCa3]|uniref:hypothetical protein n=1 Tax=Pseudoalteromonas sp. GutCa3 TaxID=888433 RepID=UPI000C33E2CF|nr:hypothetical protein [Pseudoalteromonas sp. GutCa3]PKG68650.1 hypothetical protein CXF64_20220 [Pseudoalteromonas sp. GutCa3]
MPNSNQLLPPPFYTFILTYYSNNAYVMLDKFRYEISDIANQVSIDWDSSRSNLALDGLLVKGSKVFGLEKADKGRVSILAKEASFDITDENGNSFTIKFPLIRFNNFRKHFSEPLWFNGLDSIKREYQTYKSGNRITRYKPDPNAAKDREAAIKKSLEIESELVKNAIKKDKSWLYFLKPLKTACPYFYSKGVAEIYLWCDLYYNDTKDDNYFTALKLVSVKTWEFSGLQRIYPIQNKKLFRKGLNPSFSAFFVPSRLPIDGEDIYVLEAPADAGMSFKLTGVLSVAALMADNIANVVLYLRLSFPNSRIILVADNDQYGDSLNKGVDVCENVLRNTEGPMEMIIPSFEDAEKKLEYKDLTDFVKAYGEAKGQELLRLSD